jgi:hypothetical protein
MTVPALHGVTTDALDVPRFSDADLWIARYDAIRHVAHLELNEAITEDEADQRIGRLTRFNHTLTVEDRNATYEILKDALHRLSCLNMPGGCPCHDFNDIDQRNAELDADADAHYAIKKLAGERPAVQP